MVKLGDFDDVPKDSRVGDVKWKLSGSFGYFYDVMKYTLAQGSVGGDYWFSHVYRLDNTNVAGLGKAWTRFVENEAEEILHYLKGAGLRPEMEGTLESSDGDEVVVSSDDGRHAVTKSVAETVSVKADPAPAPRPPLPEQLELSSDRYGR